MLATDPVRKLISHLDPMIGTDLLLKASITALFPELYQEIALYLPHDDLKTYSLASRMLNSEANRFLWRSVVVSPHKIPCEDIRAFAEALARDPVRAANIRHIKSSQQFIRMPLPPVFRCGCALGSFRLSGEHG